MIHYKFINSSKEKTMVFVHGFTQNYKIFERQIEYFKNSFNILLVDLRGHGGSSMIDGPYGLEEYTDDLQDLFWELSLWDVILWGTHTGTAIALKLYLRNSKYISAMILEGVVIPGFIAPQINKNIVRARNITTQLGLEKAIEDWLKKSQWFKYMRDNPKHTRYEDHKSIIQTFSGSPWKSHLTPKNVDSIINKLDQLELPILAYNGRFDMKEFLIMTAILQKATNACTKVIPDSGGFPLWENPTFVNQLVKEFLNSNLKRQNLD